MVDINWTVCWQADPTVKHMITDWGSKRIASIGLRIYGFVPFKFPCKKPMLLGTYSILAGRFFFMPFVAEQIARSLMVWTTYEWKVENYA